MVWCSACGTGIPTAFSCQALGASHLKIGLNAYLINDSYTSNKNIYTIQQAYQVFCPACYALGHYHKKLIEKYPEIVQEYAKDVTNKLTEEYKKASQMQRVKIAAAQEEIVKLKTQIQQFATLEGIYRRFQSLYKNDEKKMRSLQTFKKFGKQMGNKDSEFKKKFDDLQARMEKQYINSSIIRIQIFFSSFIKLIDKKMNCCIKDMDRLKQLRNTTMQRCSQPNSFANSTLLNSGRLRTMQSLFDNQMRGYESILAELKALKSQGIVGFNEEELQLSKMNRSFYISDAQMHEKQEWRSTYFQNVVL